MLHRSARHVASLAVSLALAALPAMAAPARSPAVARSTADTRFAALSARYLDELARAAPAYATALGDHRFDDRLNDLSAIARARNLSGMRALLAAVKRIDPRTLSRDNQVDAALLTNQLRYDLWSTETLQPWAWDTQSYNDAAGGALYALAARDFAPWPVRLRATTQRMAAYPAFFAEMRRQLVPARVPAIYATTLARQNHGLVDIAEGMLSPHRGELSATDAAAFDRSVATLKGAVLEQQRWIDTVLVPQAQGDFRLGRALYDQKLKFALVGALTRPEIKARATAEVARVRAQMYALAQRILNDPATASPTPGQVQATIARALALTYAERPARDGLMPQANATLAQATAFVRAKNLVSVPDAPVRIITMPQFQQGVAVAYCDSPGPLDRALLTFYAISPIPVEWSDAQATSFLSEYNNYMIHDLSIHEAMPGHYLQIAHANANPSTLRAVLSSGPFVEGWAVYAEAMMSDAGYLDGDPRFKLTVLKMRLRSVTNSLLDIGIHAEGMTREQAMALMTQTAFQQEREAAGKWVRAQLSSTQLLSYYSGYAEHIAMRDEAMRRQGARFDLKAYNDAVLSHGSPPARFVRALMFDEPVPTVE